MTGIRLQSITLTALLLLASIPSTLAQSSGAGSGGGAASPGGSSSGGAQSPGATDTMSSPARPPLPSSQPSAGSNSSAETGQGGALTAPIEPPDTAGSTGNPRSTGTINRRQGISDGSGTDLGKIGPETEREKKAQQESDRATKGICDRC